MPEELPIANLSVRLKSSTDHIGVVDTENDHDDARNSVGGKAEHGDADDDHTLFCLADADLTSPAEENAQQGGACRAWQGVEPLTGCGALTQKLAAHT